MTQCEEHRGGISMATVAGMLDARGWESVFWGGTIFFKISKIQKFDRPKIPRFHKPPSIIQKVARSFQNYFRFSEIDLSFNGFRISKIYQDSTILFLRFYSKRLRLKIVLDPPHNYFSILVPLVFPFFKTLEFQQMWFWEICSWNFLRLFEVIW